MTIKELLDGIEFGWLTDLKVAEIKTITHKAEEKVMLYLQKIFIQNALIN